MTHCAQHSRVLTCHSNTGVLDIVRTSQDSSSPAGPACCVCRYSPRLHGHATFLDALLSSIEIQSTPTADIDLTHCLHLLYDYNVELLVLFLSLSFVTTAFLFLCI